MTAKWTADTAKLAIESAGLQVAEQKAIDHGVQFILSSGTPINVYPTTGRVNVQGRASDEKTRAQALFSTSSPSTFATPMTTTAPPRVTLAPAVPEAPKKVFIVYGHDVGCRKELELLLLRLGLEPFVLSDKAPDGKTIIEALLANSDVPYAIVLLTPDDEGHRAGVATEKRFRARQNVVLELGMFLMKLGRERVAILHKGNVELPSDINGLIYMPFNNSVDEVKNKIFGALHKAGFALKIDALAAG
ncbi:DNA-binding protein [Corallococcus exiguus]|nr:DNA-binding protein [Corallococcus exiguus]